MVNREKNIMNNHVLLAAIYLDPRFNVILSEEQSDNPIKHIINIWIYLKQIESERKQSKTTNYIDDHQFQSLNNLTHSDEFKIYQETKMIPSLPILVVYQIRKNLQRKPKLKHF